MPSTLHVTSLLDDGSAGTLRAAIVTAEKGDTIVFDSSASSGTIYLNGSELLLDKSLTITGHAEFTLNISGNDASRVFEVAEKANVRLENLTISHGRAVYNGDNVSRFGGVILSYGTLTLDNCALQNNGSISIADEAGGAIFNAGTLTANSCLFNYNVAHSGAPSTTRAVCGSAMTRTFGTTPPRRLYCSWEKIMRPTVVAAWLTGHLGACSYQRNVNSPGGRRRDLEPRLHDRQRLLR